MGDRAQGDAAEQPSLEGVPGPHDGPELLLYCA